MTNEVFVGLVFFLVVGYAVALGVPSDAWRSYRLGETRADRIRLFKYYQCVRNCGVMEALRRYGVETGSRR